MWATLCIRVGHVQCHAAWRSRGSFAGLEVGRCFLPRAVGEGGCCADASLEATAEASHGDGAEDEAEVYNAEEAYQENKNEDHEDSSQENKAWDSVEG